MEFHGDLTRDKFLLEWFGIYGGRELATRGPDRPYGRHFTDNPREIIAFVDEMYRLNYPAWMSVLPMAGYGKPTGLDRIYFDFDDRVIALKC